MFAPGIECHDGRREALTVSGLDLRVALPRHDVGVRDHELGARHPSAAGLDLVARLAFDADRGLGHPRRHVRSEHVGRWYADVAGTVEPGEDLGERALGDSSPQPLGLWWWVGCVAIDRADDLRLTHRRARANPTRS